MKLHSHTVVSDLAVRAVGAHGMFAGWSATPTIDIRISDCVFENIGGSELVNFSPEIRVRYGNGVEFGSNCADAIVERCEFHGEWWYECVSANGAYLGWVNGDLIEFE